MKKDNCGICQSKIENERFLILTTYTEKDKKISTAFYHEFCFRNKFMEFADLKKTAMDLVTRGNTIINQGRNEGVWI